MSRTAEGWALVWRRGIARVRFTHRGRRYEITTGQRDPFKAAEVAAIIYADIVSGRVRQVKGGALIHPASPLDELCADWIDAIANELGEGTDRTYEVYARHWCRAMPTVADLTPAGIGDYQRARLGSVVRSTVIKERSALRRLCLWLVERGMLADVPEFPALPRLALGTKHKQGRRVPLYVPSPEECEAVLAMLTDRTSPFFVALYETALRPRSTLARLEPGDLTPAGLHIRPECDKNRFERTIPISDRARAAFAALPFGSKDRRSTWDAAVKVALGEGRKLTPYDLKHARITQWIDEGRPLGGISFRTGVSEATLVARYAHATRRAADWGPAPQPGSDMQETAPIAEQPAPVEPVSADSDSLEVLAGLLPCGFKSRPSHESTDSAAPVRPQNSALPAVVRVALFARGRAAA